MLTTTLFDAVVKEHVGGVDELLPAIVNAYLKATGAQGNQKLGQYQRMVEMEKDKNGDEVISTTACRRNRLISSLCDGTQDQSEGNVVCNDESDSSAPDEGISNPEMVGREVVELEGENADDVLREAGVEISIEILLEFERGSSEIGGSFDFVIADPFQKIGTDPAETDKSNHGGKNSRVLEELCDEKGVTLYLQSLRRLMQRGGYLFLFLDWSKLQQWKKCSAEGQFDVVCDPFLVMKDTTRVQKMNLKGLQGVYEPALVLRKPGEHPDGFEMDKSSRYVHLPACRMPRWCNVIDGVPPPAQRITFKPSRAQVRPSEKPCSLFIEILTTFCPPLGRVLDPFAGTLTTGLACMATDRRCILLETDEKCVSHAKERAFDFAKSRLVAMSQSLNRGNGCGDPDGNEKIGESRNEETETEFECEDNESVARSREDADPSEQSTGELNERRGRNRSPEQQRTQDAADSSTNIGAKGRGDSSRTSNAQQQISESPPGSGISKQLPHISSSQATAEDENFSKDSGDIGLASSISTRAFKKRNRNIRSPAPIRTATVYNRTPSAYRRSKRSRKTTLRYNNAKVV